MRFVHDARGVGFGAGVGVICLLLAFFSLQVLPINAVGASLIVFGLVSLVMEMITPTHGILTFVGLLSFTLGSFLLIDVPREFGIPHISAAVIFPTVAVTGLFFGYAVNKTLQSRRRRPTARRAPCWMGATSARSSVPTLR